VEYFEVAIGGVFWVAIRERKGKVKSAGRGVYVKV
jgi:hypothetical protein